jgi:hypothetical protein
LGLGIVVVLWLLLLWALWWAWSASG